ncbi:hypothetical protein CTRI78_v003430 [Colletotrichum trifolii]|uniref:G protein-coupled receptor GPR1/2/3 C-terminal domain-containing protein n=1 Tax=Colletotrichum trifolii TaxID=5466 RepID=A0A4R8RJH1_COLTR|nr:hypothetical protein CTRI78_v003430 [Colletotrichum trifolii]
MDRYELRGLLASFSNPFDHDTDGAKVFPDLRSFRHRLILGLAISDFIMAFNFLCSTAMNVAGRFIGAPGNADFCSYNGFVTQVFGMPWFFSVLWASIGQGLVGYGDIGAWCWFQSDELRLLVNFIQRWVIIVAMFVIYAILYIVLYRAHLRLRSLEERPEVPQFSRLGTLIQTSETGVRSNARGRYTLSIKRLKRIARLMLLYPLAYAIIWSLPTAIRIYQATTGKSAPFVLQTLEKTSMVIQGFVDAVIYSVNETSLLSWCTLLSRQRLPTSERAAACGPSPGARRLSIRLQGRNGRVDTVSDSTDAGDVEIGPTAAPRMGDTGG